MLPIFGGRYFVCPEGNIYSNVNNAGKQRKSLLLMKTKIDRAGYLSLVLTKNPVNGVKRECVYVHRVVAQAYIPNPENKPQVNHINGIKTDNRVCNLEWATASENGKHAYKNGLSTIKLGAKGRFNELHGKSKPINMLDCSGNVIKTFPSLQEAARQGFSQGNISSVIYGHRNTHKGYKWEFA